MDKLQKQIVSYLQKNFGDKKPFIYSASLTDLDTDIWGYNSIKILVKETDKIIFYKMTSSK